MTEKMRLLIVDDHVLMRDGLIRLFESHPDFEVVGDVGTVCDAVAKTIELEPDLVLMDIMLPDGDGVEATRVILAKRPKTKIVMLTMHETDELLFAALRSGAKGYLLKNTPAAKLVTALRAMGRGEAALSREMTNRLMDEFTRMGQLQPLDSTNLDSLTARELEVLGCLASGLSNRQIAAQLFISEHTVKHHIHSIYKKMKFKNRREAVNFANRQGLQHLSNEEDTDPGSKES